MNFHEHRERSEIDMPAKTAVGGVDSPRGSASQCLVIRESEGIKSSSCVGYLSSFFTITTNCSQLHSTRCTRPLSLPSLQLLLPSAALAWSTPGPCSSSVSLPTDLWPAVRRDPSMLHIIANDTDSCVVFATAIQSGYCKSDSDYAKVVYRNQLQLSHCGDSGVKPDGTAIVSYRVLAPQAILTTLSADEFAQVSLQ